MNSVTPVSRTALVVEDEQHMLNLLHDVLEDAGFETTTATSGSLAMTLLAERRFDVLLIDITLPDMNGLVICDAARERYQNQIAILAITGFNIQNRRVSSLQLGADDFLGKPFDVNELIAHIEGKLRRVPKG